MVDDIACISSHNFIRVGLNDGTPVARACLVVECSQRTPRVSSSLTHIRELNSGVCSTGRLAVRFL